MTSIVISGTGVYTPTEAISNQELVASFNAWVDQWNAAHQADIEAGKLEAKSHSSVEFIEKASGIKSRYVVNKSGVLDINLMRPVLRERSNDEPSLHCEMSMAAAEEALHQAGRKPEEVDFVLAAVSNFPRPYPALAVEVQHFLGCKGFAFDMNVACSSATFAIKTAVEALQTGGARCVLIVNPEICSGHLDFRDRDSHFIFGDVCSAIVLERKDDARSGGVEVLGCKLVTEFSNNIRNNFGFLNRTHPETRYARDKLFVQEGRKVFKEVCPMVAELITGHLDEMGLSAGDLKRLWLHQANINMNQLIARKVLGREPEGHEAPNILDRYANTSSAGSIVAFHFHRDGLQAGDLGVISSFGAGYSAGSVVVRA
ncbi:beta-ketoacyl-ACP synthase III [Permianibacter aggregans]|uniref:Beta-ketodecanoyl-[acyl-carrier-protein] synthase n=1 Tax=Permianibacter aggregans TaxID=1510150 RepID=A0A4R6V4Z1_9GAMM|nr:beta-ketoacyl-ACP synthase III [Permianibacter aggregans]QGX41443.1 beta-ketoacyl-ACP synthase III [Permianibacter aggregans]TDQ51234.1 beta-ketodecanoyl-[acyl-carrier-protein] synthase [Permianibacter aggregans]